MAQPNVAPEGYSYQPPSYDECMGNQPPGYPQSAAPTGGLHPPPPPHTYVTNTGLSDYERAKRDKKQKRILTIGIVMTLCTVFLVVILYIKLNLYHEAQRRHMMQNHFRIEDNENSYWSRVPDRSYNEYSPQIDIPRVSQEEVDAIQQHFKKIFDTVVPSNFNKENTQTGLNSKTETESYDLIHESATVGLVNGTTDF